MVFRLDAPYGGVVPEIASRDHLRCLLPLIKKILDEAKVIKPDVIAYTAGPGLIGALMVGGGLANGLALAWQCKVIPIHHMEGHLLKMKIRILNFLFLALRFLVVTLKL